MPFNPLAERGLPLERQLRSWSELNVQPYDTRAVHPYTRCRVIVMNGIEAEAIGFSHNFNRNCADVELKQRLQMVRRVEQQQQKAVNWLIPGEQQENAIEVTIGYEQVAVDLTAWLARHEPDPYLRQVYEFGLLEDFDHLYRYANLMDLMGNGRRAEEITGSYTEITPGRPTIFEHRDPRDDIRRPMTVQAAHRQSILNAMTLVSAEQQTMNYYMNFGNRPADPLARAEERHVRVWSVGCASGEEPYSLAMLFAEQMGVQAFCDRVKIYATDLDEEALKTARHATYTPRDVESVPSALLEKYFERTNNHYVFHRDLRKCVIFGRHNVVRDAPISRIDLLVCRNLLIYLEAETQDVVLPRLHYALTNEGVLFLGKAETQLARSSLFRPVDMKHRIFTKVAQEWRRTTGGGLTVAREYRSAGELVGAHGRLLEAVLNESQTAFLVVDETGLVTLANAMARQLLSVGAFNSAPMSGSRRAANGRLPPVGDLRAV